MNCKINKFLTTVLLATFVPAINSQVLPPRTGEFTISSTVLEIMGTTDAQTFTNTIDITDPIYWEVYVPELYAPDKPSGVLVFINSRNSGKIEQEWKAVMEKSNLIYIGANNSGNDIAITHRVAYAIMAPKLVNKSYNINPNRVYISGFSGGSRVASMVATEYNNLFNGAIYNSGANFWGDEAQARYNEMQDNYYTFITGTEDFNLEDTKNVFNSYKSVGVKNSKLIVVPDMAHKRPSAEILRSAIRYLDSGL